VIPLWKVTNMENHLKSPTISAKPHILYDANNLFFGQELTREIFTINTIAPVRFAVCRKSAPPPGIAFVMT
jgi:hypothetical protein